MICRKLNTPCIYWHSIWHCTMIQWVQLKLSSTILLYLVYIYWLSCKLTWQFQQWKKPLTWRNTEQQKTLSSSQDAHKLRQFTLRHYSSATRVVFIQHDHIRMHQNNQSQINQQEVRLQRLRVHKYLWCHLVTAELSYSSDCIAVILSIIIYQSKMQLHTWWYRVQCTE